MSPRLDLVVGCNGAGKSTLVERHLQPLLHTPFVNADLIAGQKWPDAAQAHSYDAARLAAATRDALIGNGTSFIAETVFSHPSKLELLDRAHAAGYRVVLHVLLIPEELAVHRVRLRVDSGGHAVPEHKIRERYQRLWPLIREAITRSDQATVYANESPTTRIVARFVDGMPAGSPDWPRWSPTALTEGW
ncbi:zeta toxin family protein [Gordonia sp. zg691]|uniref:UDP-N-acetylglucosamine kinase n=1 Tax=Gordonia jinghuaiqii TaxID=2758710 RepID=A0A7D7RA40_9ACTN|nr:zeta toxin family protein [Gordonia jinghuaiqii]MBD0863655.1 zeta toxin family protein [Gordonia jinghuaiqii]MCR5979389.1 AAA family ATPase [Gordonia jinghuaiqii]QMT01170.1 zeta toxin family protein [Gordonia jinghuaiqii]